MCDLAWIVGRDEKLVSHHVRALRAAGLASSARDGKMVMYELTDRGRTLLTAVRGRRRAHERADRLPLAAPAVPRRAPVASITRALPRVGAPRAVAVVVSLGAMSVEGIARSSRGSWPGRSHCGFGLDSAVEGFASVIIIWRFTGPRVMSQTAEQRAQKLVAIQFFILRPMSALSPSGR